MKSLLMKANALTSLRTITFTLLFCAVLTVIAAPAQTILLQENFDELTPHLTVTSAGVFTAVNGTNVDIVGGNLFPTLCASPESGNCLDLDGSNGNSQGDIQSTPVALFPGIQYTLSFDLIGSGRDTETSTTVTFGSYYSHTFDLLSNDVTSGIVNFQFTVPSQTSAYLEFKSNTSGNIGAVLDNVSITASVLPPQTLTLTLLDSGTGTVTDDQEQINCTEAGGVVTGTCSASYPSGTQVTLTASPNVPSSVFAGWGGACGGENSDGTTCVLIMSSAQSVSASFDIPGQTVTATIPTASGSQPTVYSYNGGYTPDSGGYDYTAQGTNSGPSAPTFPAETTAIPTALATCNNTIAPSFPGADCFVYQFGPTPDPTKDSPVMFELTCPSSPGEQCGSIALPDFLAQLGSDFSFDVGENPPLNLVNSNPNISPYGPLQAAGGNPYVGFLKGEGPDPAHPCTPFPPADPRNQGMFSNQIISFNLTDPGSKPVVANSGGTGSCWIVVYLTSDETPTVSITQPANGGFYVQGQNDPTTKAAYVCNTIYNGIPTPTGGTYPLAGPTGPYLTGTCSATDTPGGSVSQTAQFDTATVGSHTFTATVLDSATNTASQTVTYTVQGTQTIMLSGVPSSAVYGSTFTVGATGGASGNPVTFTSSGGCSIVSGSTYQMTSGATPCSVIANQAGNTNYLAATQVMQNVNATPAAQTITLSGIPSSAAYNTTFTVGATGGGSGNPVTFTSAGVCTNLGATYKMTNSTGSCSVIANQAGNMNYSAAPPVTKTVNATGPLLSVTPASFNFGNVNFDLDLNPAVITVKNIGTATASISNVSLTRGIGTNAVDFTLINLCPSTLAAGKTCYISALFFSGNLGPVSATVALTDNAPGSPQQVTLAANVIGFNPSSLNFGTVKVGHSSTQSVTLTNTGATALTIGTVSVSGANAHDFVKSSGCPSSLAPTLSCTISVTFTPSATGSRSANLSLSDNAALGTLIAPLSGKGN